MGRHTEITPEQAHGRLAELHAVDVREEHEFEGPLGRIAGAQLAPLTRLEAWASGLPKDKPLLLVCRSGGRSGKACEALVERGHGPVINLAGGMMAWNRAGLPVQQAEPSSLAELFARICAWWAQVRSLPPAQSRARLGRMLEGLGASSEAPTHGALDGLLREVEASFPRGSAPPDLDLSLASFRRWLADL
jgi:rhodanese-related sulfurtransferase